MDNNGMMKVERVAEVLGLSQRTVRIKIQGGSIPARRFGRGHYRVPEAWVRRMVSDTGKDQDTPQAA